MNINLENLIRSFAVEPGMPLLAYEATKGHIHHSLGFHSCIVFTHYVEAIDDGTHNRYIIPRQFMEACIQDMKKAIKCPQAAQNTPESTQTPTDDPNVT